MISFNFSDLILSTPCKLATMIQCNGRKSSGRKSSGRTRRCLKWGVVFALYVWSFGTVHSCPVQQSDNSSPNIKVSNSRKIVDDDPEKAESSTPPNGASVDSQVKGIHKRIDILKEIIAKKTEESAAPKAVRKAEEADPKTGNLLASPPTPLNSTESAADDPKKEPKNEPKKKSSPDPNEKRPPEPALPSKANPLEGLEINMSQINSLELANSLFQTQNYAQALKCYETLLIVDNSELDTAWLRCLTANCYRVQKQYTKAERLYRDVAGFTEKTFPNDHAQWYLDHIARRTRIESELNLLENELAPFKNEKEEKK